MKNRFNVNKHGSSWMYQRYTKLLPGSEFQQKISLPVLRSGQKTLQALLQLTSPLHFFLLHSL